MTQGYIVLHTYYHILPTPSSSTIFNGCLIPIRPLPCRACPAAPLHSERPVPIHRHINMGPLFHRSSVLAQPGEFISAIRLRQQQLPRLVCRHCQFVVLRRQPYSIDTGKTPPGPAGDDSSKVLHADGGNKPAEDAAPSGSARIDFTKLPSAIENRRMDISKRFSMAMNDLQGAFFVARRRLNEMTGYAGIEQMKKAIEAQGTSSFALCFVAPY